MSFEVEGRKRGGQRLVWIEKKQVSVNVSKSCDLESGPLSNARSGLLQSRVQLTPPIHVSLAISPTVEAWSCLVFECLPSEDSLIIFAAC
jgi:hypothetical protein